MSTTTTPLTSAGPLTIDAYDTTLRDGAQQEGMNLSVADKLAIAALLDELGVGYIEGGWPGAIPKDTEFFARAAKELDLRHARLAAFGSTCKAGVRPHDDPQVRALVDSEAPVVTIVAKSDIRHVERALRTTGEENLRMISESVRYLKEHGREVFVDLEHFFDGYRFDAEYTLSAAAAAFGAGADVVVLCDTNGGMLPGWVTEIVTAVRSRVEGKLGIHAHNDTGCAVANSIAAVEAGVDRLGPGPGRGGDLQQPGQPVEGATVPRPQLDRGELHRQVRAEAAVADPLVEGATVGQREPLAERVGRRRDPLVVGREQPEGRARGQRSDGTRIDAPARPRRHRCGAEPLGGERQGRLEGGPHRGGEPGGSG